MHATRREKFPPKTPAVLLEELTSTLSELERLMRAINRTNAQAILGNGTVTDALAHRDVLRLRHSAVNAAADAASGREERGYGRQLRSELVYVAAVPVTELRAIADDPRPRDSRGRYTDSTNELGGGSDRVSTAALEQVGRSAKRAHTRDRRSIRSPLSAAGSAPTHCSPARRTGKSALRTHHHHVLIVDRRGRVRGIQHCRRLQVGASPIGMQDAPQ